jgi:molybdopterin-dependent oxidoreductase alpha subunit
VGETKHTGPIQLNKRWKPSLWVSWVPFGLGIQKPHHFRDMIHTIVENRDNLGYAWRILSQGVCDGCALGVAGLQDQTLSGPHLCTTRLNVLRLNTMPAMDPALLEDVEYLRKLSSAELRKLGRIPYPLSRRPGEKAFTRLSWEEALNRIAGKIRTIRPEQLSFYLTARGITNETYYVAQKVARFLGTNHIDNASRICHSPSKTAMKRSLGIAASSCSYKDWIGTDVLLFWGSIAAANQPVSTKYMYAAKKAGTRIILINPYREPSMERYWIPSIGESALFGTEICNDFFQVNIGGDIALMNGIMKIWFEMEDAEYGSAIDHHFVREHADGFAQLEQHVCAMDWTDIERSSGLKQDRIMELAIILANAKSAVFIWSMGLTQHRFGSDNISQICNLALLRGFIGREFCGVMPIRGHSGVQGAGEMGAEPMSLPGGVPFTEQQVSRFSNLWGFTPPTWPGHTVGTTLGNCRLPHEDPQKIKLFYTSGGNFLETMPDPDAIRQSLENVEMRVHQDIVFNTSTLADALEEVIILPAMTRYEQPGGGTSTSTERMVYYSPEIEGPRIEEARAEWEIYVDLARHVYPEKPGIQFDSLQQVREEIARAVPYYDGIQKLRSAGEVFQWGGAWLCENGVCPTDSGKGLLLTISIPQIGVHRTEFRMTTRRGKQFNSMVYANTDPFNAAVRNAVIMNIADGHKMGICNGDSIVLYNPYGEFRGVAEFGDIQIGNIEVYWPEGNQLLPGGVYEPLAEIPEYNTDVRIERLDRFDLTKEQRYAEKPVQDLQIEVE